MSFSGSSDHSIAGSSYEDYEETSYEHTRVEQLKQRVQISVKKIKPKEKDVLTKRERANLNALKNIPVEPTVFADIPLLKEMGLYSQVRRIFSLLTMGSSFPLMSAFTYDEVTRYFLATLKVDYEEDNKSMGTLSFTIVDKTYSMPIGVFCGLLGLKNGMYHSNKTTRTRRADEAWKLLTGEERVDFQKSRHSKVRNPAYRFALKLLGLTLFARSEVSATQKEELAVLSIALSDFTRKEAIKKGENIGCMFLDHVLSFMAKAKKGTLKSGLRFGGLITHLLSVLGEDLTSFTPMSEEIPTMDRPYLFKSSLIKKELMRDGKPVFLYEFSPTLVTTSNCYLPLNAYTDVELESHIEFLLPPHLCVQFDIPYNEDGEEEIDTLSDQILEFHRVTLPPYENYATLEPLPEATTDDAKVYKDLWEKQEAINKKQHGFISKMFGVLQSVTHHLVKTKTQRREPTPPPRPTETAIVIREPSDTLPSRLHKETHVELSKSQGKKPMTSQSTPKKRKTSGATSRPT